MYLWLCFIAIACCFTSCSYDEGQDWMYGEKQELVGTEWKNVPKAYTNSPLPGSDIVIPIPTETLHFDSNGFTLTKTSWRYNSDSQKVEDITTTTVGDYSYNHPNLKLTFEDNSETEAYISAKNTIYFHTPKGTFNEFTRE